MVSEAKREGEDGMRGSCTRIHVGEKERGESSARTCVFAPPSILRPSMLPQTEATNTRPRERHEPSRMRDIERGVIGFRSTNFI